MNKDYCPLLVRRVISSNTGTNHSIIHVHWAAVKASRCRAHVQSGCSFTLSNRRNTTKRRTAVEWRRLFFTSGLKSVWCDINHRNYWCGNELMFFISAASLTRSCWTKHTHRVVFTDRVAEKRGERTVCVCVCPHFLSRLPVAALNKSDGQLFSKSVKRLINHQKLRHQSAKTLTHLPDCEQEALQVS